MTESAKIKTEDRSTQTADEDFAIYPLRDHLTADAVPFKLDDYGDRGAFSEEQIQTLSDRHSLSVTLVRELSRLVGYSLDIKSQVSLVTISRATAARRLSDRKLGKRGRDLQLDASEANVLIDSFGLNAIVLDDAELARAGAIDPNVPNNGIACISLDEAQRILQPDDLRQERDSRRLIVVESCCYVALDAGWSLTYTTDFKAEKNQRGGRLIDLIKDVIAIVSHQARIASVHTLKNDIERIRRRFELRGDLPPRQRQKQRS